MAKKDCTTCGNAEWVKTKTGKRRLSNGFAECNVDIKFPLSYMSHWGNFPSKGSVYSTTCSKVTCSFWKPAGKKENSESPVNYTQQLKAAIACVEKASIEYLGTEDSNLVVISMRLLAQRAAV